MESNIETRDVLQAINNPRLLQSMQGLPPARGRVLVERKTLGNRSGRLGLAANRKEAAKLVWSPRNRVVRGKEAVELDMMSRNYRNLSHGVPVSQFDMVLRNLNLILDAPHL